MRKCVDCLRVRDLQAMELMDSDDVDYINLLGGLAGDDDSGANAPPFLPIQGSACSVGAQSI